MGNKRCKPTEENKKIVTLQTQIHSMTTKKVDGKIPAKGKKPFHKSEYKVPTQNLYHRTEVTGNGKRHTRTQKSKSFNRKPRWWCDAHKRFVEHKPEECRLAQALKPKNLYVDVSLTITQFQFYAFALMKRIFPLTFLVLLAYAASN